jgi:hypothetical protein
MLQVGSFHGISMLAGMSVALMLYGCAKRLGGAQAPGAIVELAGQLQLAWERPTRKADGTFLTDIAGYKLYYGLTSRTFDVIKTVSNQTRYTIAGLEGGRTYYFTVMAYDASGNESRFSNEVSITVSLRLSQTPMLTQAPLTRGREAQFRVVGVDSDEGVSCLFGSDG